MADKAITDLTQAQQITGDDLFVLEQGGEAKKLKGSQVVQYAKDAVAEEVQGVKEYADNAKASADAAAASAEKAATAAQGIDDKVAAADASAKAAASSAAAAAASATGVDEKVQAAQTAADNAAKSETAAKDAQTAAANAQKAAETAQTGAQSAKTAAESAQEAAESAKDAAAGSATAAGQKATQAAQSAEDAASAKSAAETAKTDAQAARDAIANMIVEAVTLETGKPATVTKSLVDNVYKLVFGLPKGETGATGPQGATGNGISDISLKSGNHAPGTSDVYTITLTDGTTFDFAVYNGANGQGAGDMLASVYDPQGKRTDIYKYADNASVYEAKLKWGGESISADVTPIDAAMLPSVGNNKAEFSNADGVSVEYSTDGGATWADYNASKSQKTRLLSANLGTVLVAGKDAEASLNNKLRITVNANTCGFYTLLKKVLIEINTAGTQECSVIIERARGNSQDTFETIGTYQISGASGWNSLDVAKGANFYFGGSSSQTSNWWVMRFTFSMGGFGTWGSNKLTVSKLLFLGTSSWIIPSNLAKTGHLYSYDDNQNATFPAKVEASGFIGGASDTTVAFSTATTRANIATGEKLSVLFGKIAKWFVDLGALAFKDKVAKTDLASDVQTSLGKADSALQSPPMRKVTLPVANWDSSTMQQTVACTGILSDKTKQRVFCAAVDESYDSAWNTCYVQCVGRAANSLTFQCDEIPTVAVEVFVTIEPVAFAS